MDDFKSITEIVPILFFLLPGFLTAKMLELLVIAKPKDVFDRVVQAFVFTFVNLVCFTFARWCIEKMFNVNFDHVEFFTAKNLLLMAACAAVIAVVCSYEMKNEHVLNLLRKVNVTKKTYKSCTWVETFDHAEKFVVVHLKDGRRIYGWPRFYSDDPTERAIFLEAASWLGDKNELLNTPRISILLDVNSGIQLIEFL
jgi:hypothetical protein